MPQPHGREPMLSVQFDAYVLLRGGMDGTNLTMHPLSILGDRAADMVDDACYSMQVVLICAFQK